MPEGTEDRLIVRLKRNPAEAFEELVATHGKRLFQVAFRILDNREDAEEALQNAFLKVFQSIRSFRGDSSLYSWLYRIVANESFTLVRKRGRVFTVPVEDHLPRYDYGQHTIAVQGWELPPDSALQYSELQEFYLRCVRELPEKYRLPYILKDMEKLSENDVVDIVELPLSTVKNRIHRARLAIRRRIEERFGGPGSSAHFSHGLVARNAH